MNTVFAAQLIPGVPVTVLSDGEAGWLKTGDLSNRSENTPTREQSFVYVKGPNTSVSVSESGRFVACISGNYFMPGTVSGVSAAEKIQHGFNDGTLDFLARINGGWRLFVFDNESSDGLIAVDRMGSQRMCYAKRHDGRVTFGSNSDIVARIQNASLAVSANSILKYFYFHCIPSPSTVYEQVQCIAPAEALVWNEAGLTAHRYWTPQFADMNQDGDRVSPAELFETLDSAIKTSCRNDKTATFLSGGLDSSTVLGFASKYLKERVTPYTIGFDEQGYDETEYARMAAQHFGASLTRYEVTPHDVVTAISTVAETYDEPFGNSSAIPTFYCAKAAFAAGETRILAGDGGDELFAGNDRYRIQQIFSYYDKVPRIVQRRMLEPIFLRLLSSNSFFPVRKARRYIEQARIPMPDRLQTYNFLNVHEVENIFSATFLEAVDLASPLRHMQSIYDQSGTDCLIDRMLYLDWRLTLADNDLRKVTTMCEHVGINVLFPMLDNRLIDISCRIPGSVKMGRGKLRDFYKKSVASFLPHEIIHKSKHGFGLPFGPWFSKSEELRKHMNELVDNLCRRNIIRSDYIDQVRKATLSEHAGYFGEMIWLMCILECWLSKRQQLRNYKF